MSPLILLSQHAQCWRLDGAISEVRQTFTGHWKMQGLLSPHFSIWRIEDLEGCCDFWLKRYCAPGTAVRHLMHMACTWSILWDIYGDPICSTWVQMNQEMWKEMNTDAISTIPMCTVSLRVWAISCFMALAIIASIALEEKYAYGRNNYCFTGVFSIDICALIFLVLNSYCKPPWKLFLLKGGVKGKVSPRRQPC